MSNDCWEQKYGNYKRIEKAEKAMTWMRITWFYVH